MPCQKSDVEKVLDQFKDPETQQYLGPIMDNIRGAESTPEAAP